MKKIGDVLRESRINAGISVEQISDILIHKGYKASIKTIYSWENGNSSPGPDALLEMCNIYKIDNILSAFGYNGYNEDGSIQLNIKEVDIIEKYRSLDSYGKETITYILEREAERTKAQLEQISALSQETSQDIHNQNVRVINYYYRLASAGTGQIVFDTPPTKKIEIPDIPSYNKVDYAIGVNGNSMEPIFHDGDTLLIEMTDDIQQGEIGIFLVDNESYVKQLGSEELISLNPEYPAILLTENSKCMGRVVGKL